MGKQGERKRSRRVRARDEALRRGFFSDHCRISRYQDFREFPGADHSDYVVPADALVYRRWLEHGGPQPFTVTLKNNRSFYSQGRCSYVLDVIGQVPRG